MKKSYYCKKLESTLHFLPKEVKFCCSYAEQPGLKINHFGKFDIKKIKEQRNKYINMFKQGIIPEECNGCSEYKTIPLEKTIKGFFKKEDEVKKIEHITINHLKKCECQCINCQQETYSHNIKQKYSVLPIIKDLYEKKEINNTALQAEFQCGSTSLLEELDDLMLEFKENGCEDFLILTDGIKYIDILEKVGCNPKSHICISLDAGTRETYKKVKTVDKFNDVIENIKKLREHSKAQISLKYTLIQEFNDNKEELIKFLDICKKLDNIRPICMDIDYDSCLTGEQNRFVLPTHYAELFKIAENYCKENELTFEVYPHTREMLKNK